MENPEIKTEASPGDMELAFFMAGHIKAPCEDLHGHNIRDFYIREARQAMETMTDQGAKEFLAGVIDMFKEVK